MHCPLEMAPIGEVSTIVGTVDSVANRPTSKRGMIVTEVFLVDASGVLRSRFQTTLDRAELRGDRVAVIGKVEFAYGFKQMTSPQYERIEDGGAQGAILPVHRVCDGVSQAWMRRLTSVALERVGVFCDPVPVGLRARRRLMSLSRAVRCAHFPRIVPEVGLARRRSFPTMSCSIYSWPCVCATIPTFWASAPFRILWASMSRPCAQRFPLSFRASKTWRSTRSWTIWRGAIA